MADPIVAAPSIKDIERAIEMQAAKPNPDLKVIKELVETSRIILEQSGGPMRAPTTQEFVSQEVGQESKLKQALLGASTTPVRMVQGLGGLPAPTMGPSAMPTGRYSAPTLPPSPNTSKHWLRRIARLRTLTACSANLAQMLPSQRIRNKHEN